MRSNRPRRVGLRSVGVAAGIALVSGTAAAEPITFTHAGTGSGRLDGVVFTDRAFAITAVGNTPSPNPGANIRVAVHTSASIEIEGVGTYDFITDTETFVDKAGGFVGFKRDRGVDLFNGPAHESLLGWDMQTSIAPIQGEAFLFQWIGFGNVVTTGGVLVFNNQTIDATFSASVVPAPASAMAGVLGVVLIGSRRRR